MNIAILCVTNYYSGTAEQFFRSAIESLGHEVSIVSMSEPGAEGKLLSRKFDLIIHIPYPKAFRQEVIRDISKNSKTLTLGWMGDDEWLWTSNDPHSPKLIAHDYDYCVTTSRESLPLYKAMGYENVILGQWGFCELDWKPKKLKKEIDVYFCGARSAERDVYIKELMKAKINMVVDGIEYGISSYDKYYQPLVQKNGQWVRSKLDFEDMVHRIRVARIGLNFNFGVKNGKLYEQIKQRMFEIPAVGTFQLAYGAKEVSRFFRPGLEIGTFKNPQDMIKKIKYYLAHEEEREEIAKRGHQANKVNSYQRIFKRIFKEIQ